MEAIAVRRWPVVVAGIDSLVERASNGDWLKPAAGSQLESDDEVTHPYRHSQALGMLLNAGADALNGVRHVIWGPPGGPLTKPVILQAAHYVLARAAIENFATAIWMLDPPAQRQRVERVLRWYAKNVNDQHKATDPLELEDKGRSRTEKLNELCGIFESATGRDAPKGFRSGYVATDVLAYVDATNPKRNDVSAQLVWQLCSGFAHGRPWASLSFQDREQSPTGDPGVVSLRLTSDLSRSFVAPDVAIGLLERLMRLEKRRARRPY